MTRERHAAAEAPEASTTVRFVPVMSNVRFRPSVALLGAVTALSGIGGGIVGGLLVVAVRRWLS